MDFLAALQPLDPLPDRVVVDKPGHPAHGTYGRVVFQNDDVVVLALPGSPLLPQRFCVDDVHPIIH